MAFWCASFLLTPTARNSICLAFWWASLGLIDVVDKLHISGNYCRQIATHFQVNVKNRTVFFRPLLPVLDCRINAAFKISVAKELGIWYEREWARGRPLILWRYSGAIELLLWTLLFTLLDLYSSLGMFLRTYKLVLVRVLPCKSLDISISESMFF